MGEEPVQLGQRVLQGSAVSRHSLDKKRVGLVNIAKLSPNANFNQAKISFTIKFSSNLPMTVVKFLI